MSNIASSWSSNTVHVHQTFHSIFLTKEFQECRVEGTNVIALRCSVIFVIKEGHMGKRLCSEVYWKVWSSVLHKTNKILPSFNTCLELPNFDRSIYHHMWKATSLSLSSPAPDLELSIQGRRKGKSAAEMGFNLTSISRSVSRLTSFTLLLVLLLFCCSFSSTGGYPRSHSSFSLFFWTFFFYRLSFECKWVLVGFRDLA